MWFLGRGLGTELRRRDAGEKAREGAGAQGTSPGTEGPQGQPRCWWSRAGREAREAGQAPVLEGGLPSSGDPVATLFSKIEVWTGSGQGWAQEAHRGSSGRPVWGRVPPGTRRGMWERTGQCSWVGWEGGRCWRPESWGFGLQGLQFLCLIFLSSKAREGDPRSSSPCDDLVTG